GLLDALRGLDTACGLLDALRGLDTACGLLDAREGGGRLDTGRRILKGFFSNFYAHALTRRPRQ
ncbi:MAG: hypothetical protein ACP5O2_12755, partial [Bacteroidales bacterium]